MGKVNQELCFMKKMEKLFLEEKSFWMGLKNDRYSEKNFLICERKGKIEKKSNWMVHDNGRESTINRALDGSIYPG